MPIQIYALQDPRNGEIRYVGQSVNSAVRYAQHLQTRFDVTLHAWWIRRLRELGLVPVLLLLETVPTDSTSVAYARECHWIAHYAAQGHDLLNMNGPDRLRHPLPARIQALRVETVQPGELVGQRPEVIAWNAPYVAPTPVDPVSVVPRFLSECTQPGSGVSRQTLYSLYIVWWWETPAIGDKLRRPRFDAAVQAFLPPLAPRAREWAGITLQPDCLPVRNPARWSR